MKEATGRTPSVPEIARLLGNHNQDVYDEHNPPHFHVEYSGKKAVFDFNGNVLKGSLASRTSTKLV